jgi:riboflavin synthase
MFSGIIDKLGQVEEIDTGDSPRLVIRAEGWLDDVKMGDSISVNGVCLTVIELIDGCCFAADVMPETLRQTDLGGLAPGDPVNLEKALRVGDRLGGHFVSGHVDNAGRVTAMVNEKNAIVMGFSIAPELMEFIAPKGSVAIDGISLTVVGVTDGEFTVSLIPHTLEVTTLGAKSIGSPVNIEVDMLARYIRRPA